MTVRSMGWQRWPAVALPHQWKRREHQLALLLLGIVLGLLLVGGVVPQQSTTPPIEYGRWRQQAAPVSFWLESAGLTSNGRSPLLAIVVAPLILSLAHCTARRSIAIGRHWIRQGAVPVAWFGSVVFHASLLAGFASLVLSASTRFAGHLELVPGQTLVDEPARYLAVESGWWVPPPSGLALRLEKLTLNSWADGSLREQHALFRSLQGDQVTVRRGEAFDSEGVSVLLGSGAGPAALIVVGQGADRRGGWVHFPTWPGEGTSDLTFSVPGLPLRFLATIERARSGYTDEAVVHLQPIEPVGTALRLRRGESARVGQYPVEVAAIDHWTSVTVVRDPFSHWAFVAFGIGLVGIGLVVFRAPDRESRHGA